MNTQEKEFKTIFQAHFASMCLLAGKFLGDYEAARDAVHEVFMKLWETHREMGEMAYPKSYLYAAVRNHCLDLIRKGKYQSKEIPEDFRDERENEDFFETEVLREEVYQLLARAIESLPKRSQEIIKLKIAGKKNQEIAEALNISVNTVNTLKTNAYQTLRDLLKDKYVICWIIFLHSESGFFSVGDRD